MADSPRTYVCRSEYYSEEIVDDNMAKLGWIKFNTCGDLNVNRDEQNNKNVFAESKQSCDNTDIPTLVYEDGSYIWAVNTYKGKSIVKSVLGDTKRAITNKDNLFRNMRKNYPGNTHMVTQYPIQGVKSIPRGLFAKRKVWILKPVGVGFYKGKGISVVSNMDALVKAIKPKTKYVLATYITNPLLYRGHKFHIRANAIYMSNRDHIIISKLNNARIALKPYVDDHYNDAGIHDTHFTDLDHMKFNDDMKREFGDKTMNVINTQIDKIIVQTFSLFNPTAYPESTHAFEIFGFDLMVDTDLNVYLLEVNAKVALNDYDPNILFGEIIEASERLCC